MKSFAFLHKGGPNSYGIQPFLSVHILSYYQITTSTSSSPLLRWPQSLAGPPGDRLPPGFGHMTGDAWGVTRESRPSVAVFCINILKIFWDGMDWGHGSSHMSQSFKKHLFSNLATLLFDAWKHLILYTGSWDASPTEHAAIERHPKALTWLKSRHHQTVQQGQPTSTKQNWQAWSPWSLVSED